MVHCCIILHQVNTLSSRLNMDYSCTSKYFLTNKIEKTTTKIIIKMLMILDFKILSLWFVIEDWWYNTLTRENNWFLNNLVKSKFATLTPFGSVSCFVVGICLSNYNLNSFLIHQACYSKEYQPYLMHRENLGSIWKIGRYPIKVSEVLYNNHAEINILKNNSYPSPWNPAVKPLKSVQFFFRVDICGLDVRADSRTFEVTLLPYLENFPRLKVWNAFSVLKHIV